MNGLSKHFNIFYLHLDILCKNLEFYTSNNKSFCFVRIPGKVMFLVRLLI